MDAASEAVSFPYRDTDRVGGRMHFMLGPTGPYTTVPKVRG